MFPKINLMDAENRLVIQNGSILDVENLILISGQTIVIKGSKIEWIGNEGSYEKNENDKIIDASGKFVSPGLMDLHVHLEFMHEGLIEREKLTYRYKDHYWSYLALKNAQQYLKYGFTTLRGVGSETNGLASLRTLFAENKLTGPRLKVGLRSIGQPGNQELFGPIDHIQTIKDKFHPSGVDGIVAAVRDRKMDGADHIKTTTTGGVLHGQESKVDRSLWTTEELEAMVNEAERLGMYVAAHAHADVGISAAVDAGVRTIEHATMASEDTLDNMLKMGTYIVATQSAGTFILTASDEIKQKLQPEVISKWTTVSEKMIESHKIAFEKGVPIAFGTDAPVAGDHSHSPRELQLLVNHVGMTPFQAIQSSSLISARAIRMEDHLGTIFEGKIADLVILEKDPTQDISVFGDTENFHAVLKEGKIVSKKGKVKHGY